MDRSQIVRVLQSPTQGLPEVSRRIAPPAHVLTYCRPHPCVLWAVTDFKIRMPYKIARAPIGIARRLKRSFGASLRTATRAEALESRVRSQTSART